MGGGMRMRGRCEMDGLVRLWVLVGRERVVGFGLPGKELVR